MTSIQLFEFLTGIPLVVIGTWGLTDEQIDDEYLMQLISVLGPLPADLRAQWRRYSSHYSDDGKSSLFPFCLCLFPFPTHSPRK